MKLANLEVRIRGLQSHHDEQKNWDTLRCLKSIERYFAQDLRRGTKSIRVLDAGSGSKPWILQWLAERNRNLRLFACDRTPMSINRKVFRDVDFSVQEMSATSYRDSYFDAVTCISAIEHGVNTHAFFQEMARVTKVGGLLLVSTDYWPTPLNTDTLFPYGEQYGPMRVFTRAQVAAMVRDAENSGFKLLGSIKRATRAGKKVVLWKRMDVRYTFTFLSFRKSQSGS
jgi:ubiquinone/menaquinone biosynthesis C-methylase UbiE